MKIIFKTPNRDFRIWRNNKLALHPPPPFTFSLSMFLVSSSFLSVCSSLCLRSPCRGVGPSFFRRTGDRERERDWSPWLVDLMGLSAMLRTSRAGVEWVLSRLLSPDTSNSMLSLSVSCSNLSIKRSLSSSSSFRRFISLCIPLILISKWADGFNK